MECVLSVFSKLEWSDTRWHVLAGKNNKKVASSNRAVQMQGGVYGTWHRVSMEIQQLKYDCLSSRTSTNPDVKGRGRSMILALNEYWQVLDIHCESLWHPGPRGGNTEENRRNNKLYTSLCRHRDGTENCSHLGG